jgi:Zn-dependent protease
VSLLHDFDFGTIAIQFAVLFFAFAINIARALFNIIPIPLLDGHWIQYGVRPRGATGLFERMSSYGFIVSYALMFMQIFNFIFIPINWMRARLIVL